MKMKILLAALIIAAVTVRAEDKRATIVFTSDPPGQRVFVGYTTSLDKEYTKEFLGITPCTRSVPCGSHNTVLVPSMGFFSGWHRPLMVFTCEPTHGYTNLYVQKIVLHGDAHFRDPDVIPKAMFFDMYKTNMDKSDK